MMPPFTRRHFLSTLALAAPASSRILRAMAPLNAKQLVFAGIEAPEEVGRVEVYRVEQDHRELSSSTPALAPYALILHPTLPVLYVAHCVAEHQHRPRGAVSAYSIDSTKATLSLLSHEPLTLAATLPDRIALAPDGHHLLVASSSAAILNLFRLRSDGSLSQTPSPLKLPQRASSQLHIAFTDATSAIATTSPNDVEHLIIHLDSTLGRNLAALESNAAEKRKLAAQSAASIAILNL